MKKGLVVDVMKGVLQQLSLTASTNSDSRGKCVRMLPICCEICASNTAHITLQCYHGIKLSLCQFLVTTLHLVKKLKYETSLKVLQTYSNVDTR